MSKPKNQKLLRDQGKNWRIEISIPYFRSVLQNTVPPLAFGLFILGGWYLISYAILDEKKRFLLQPPHKVLVNGFFEWGGRDGLAEMLLSLWSSTKVAGIGLFFAILIGFSLAVLMSQAVAVEKALFPYLVTLQAIPILAIVPLIMFWWGSGQTSRVVVCIIISLFPIIVNTLFGLQSAEKDMHDLFTLHNASSFTRLRKLMIPAALPAIFAGLRISAGLSVIGAIVGDFFFGKGEVGLGQLIKRFSSELQGEELIAAVILSSALGVAVFLFFTWIQNRAIGRWSDRAELIS
ncbi:MAG: nitrate ABC transporter permease [Acidimicrobiaceae bacterium]|nr:nitrate ABC transporter permease [Acidimicrobiaceae bacterium]|tara:strand:- start:1872 stop:2747 length:876 start_codon:yes stop_codon:yes gene_type:complete